MTCQVNGNHWVPQSTRNLVIDSLIGCILANLKTCEKEKSEFLEINSLEVKGKFNDTIKFSTCDRGNIISKHSWKPLFGKMLS